mmetsp:Transcript_12222/g.39237  ORF Transcript_12222/g.39237 Transcript_12222/m.39237 type:complete len:103 (+) Transcript_12222:187-495(+)
MTQYAKEDIKCEGTMQKKGGMRWQKRYFILYQSGSRPAHLAYFKDEKDDGARATLELTSDTKVDLLLGKAHAFQVILRGIISHAQVEPLKSLRRHTRIAKNG